MEREQDLSEDCFPWLQWREAEAAMHVTLLGSRLATSAQEAVADRVFWLFVSSLRRGKEIRHPRAWAARVTCNELWTARRARVLEALADDSPLPAEPETPAPRRPDDPWAVITAEEARFLDRLSESERRVYEYLREHRSLKGCGERLGMSPRDVRVRLRRVCEKVEGILRGFVPPPPSTS
jgi:DNA-directed RNA polymerase specialized sigma24 family protein